MHYASSPSGFGSNNYKERFDDSEMRLSNARIWKKLYMPKHTLKDPADPYRILYNHQTGADLMREQMARRMDRKVIKLEGAFGSERQSIVVKRNADLIVSDVMEDVQKTFKIPVNEQVIFHKGTNLCDFPNERLENLGIENNQTIRITRDSDLPNRSPRSRQAFAQNGYTNTGDGGGGGGGHQNRHMMHMQNGTNMSPRGVYANGNNGGGGGGLDPVSYLKEISPQRVPDPTPYQMQVYNQNLNNPNQTQQNDVIKLFVSYGSEKEYILVHDKKPLQIHDLKRELARLFKIPADHQCIVFKGYNLHEYMDEAPLEAFGMENNSPISFWPRNPNNNTDMRLPARGPTPPPAQHNQLADVFSPRIPPQPMSSRYNSTMGEGPAPSEVIKIEIQHGSDRHPLILKGQNKNLSVLDLQNELERLTAVPVRDQKLFFRSQELHMTPYKTLRECEVENNNVIKLIGEPSKIRYSNYFGRMPVNPNSMDPNQRVFGGGAPQQQNQMQQQPQQNQSNYAYQPDFSQNY